MSNRSDRKRKGTSNGSEKKRRKLSNGSGRKWEAMEIWFQKTESGEWNEGKRTGVTTQAWCKMDKNWCWTTKIKNTSSRNSAVRKDKNWQFENLNWKKISKRDNRNRNLTNKTIKLCKW